MDSKQRNLRARWQEFKNNSGLSVPAFGVLKVTDSTLAVLQATRPNGDGEVFALNGDMETGAAESGWCTQDWPAYALYDSADGTPANGDVWGPGTNTFKLKKGNPGFVVVGEVDTTNKIVLVERQPSEPSFLAVITQKAFEGTEPVYSWVGVDQDPDNPLTYFPNDLHGEPDNFPAYHEQDVDLPVCGDPDDPLTEVQKCCVVRLRRGTGDYYLFRDPPRWEFCRKTSTTPVEIEVGGVTVVAYPGVRVRWDQATKAVVDVTSVYMVNLGAAE